MKVKGSRFKSAWEFKGSREFVVTRGQGVKGSSQGKRRIEMID